MQRMAVVVSQFTPLKSQLNPSNFLCVRGLFGLSLESSFSMPGLFVERRKRLARLIYAGDRPLT